MTLVLGNPLTVVGSVTTLTGTILVLFIVGFSKRPRPLANQLLAWFNGLIGVSGAGLMLVGLAQTPEVAVWAWRLTHVSAWMVGLLWYSLARVLCGTPRRMAAPIACAVGALCVAAILFGRTIAQTSRFPGDLYYLQATLPYLLLLAASSLLVVAGQTHLLRISRRAFGTERRQLDRLLAATPIGAFGVAMVVIPTMAPTHFYPYGVLGIPIYALRITSTILRDQLIELNVIMKRTLVAAALAVLVVGMVWLVGCWLPGWLSQRWQIRLGGFWPNVLCFGLGAALFERIRLRLSERIEPILFKQRADPAMVLKRFTTQILALVDSRQLVEMTVTTLSTTLHLQQCGLWLRPGPTDSFSLVAHRGPLDPPYVLDINGPLVRHLREQKSPLSLDPFPGVIAPAETVRTSLEVLQAHLALPLLLHEELIGFLTLGKKKSNEPFTTEELELLQPMAATLAIAVANAQLFTELVKTRAEAAEHESRATTDALTKLLVRRAFLERAQAILESTQGRSASVLMLDLDHFKTVNDTFGHLAGDAVLQEVATRLGQALRQEDLLGRFGGEEFVVLLPGADQAQALATAERLRHGVAANPMVTESGRVTQTISIGVATAPQDGVTLESLIGNADDALYAAKRAGRNRVEVVT